MKRKIKFLITVNSYFPKRHSDYQLIFPIGGEQEYHEFEFEPTGKESILDEAFAILREKMGNEIYHVWYWWWIE